jgi:Fe-S-cluster containining protein
MGIDFKNEGFIPVGPDDTFKFHCTRCGDCCRNVKESVCVESLDLFRLARHLGITTDEAMERYTDPVLITWGFPMLMLKTKPAMDSCIFLKAGKCSVYEARTRACRTYPLGTGPDDDRPGAFLDLIVSRRQHHFTGESVRVRDWIGANINDEDRAFILANYRFTGELGKILHRIDSRHEQSVLIQTLLYLYSEYDTDGDFMTQYLRNMACLKSGLLRLGG